MTAPHESGRTLSERAYEAILRIYPRALRDTQSSEYSAVFRHQRDQWRETHGGLGPRFWIFVVADALRSARREWTRPPGGERSESVVGLFVRDVACSWPRRWWRPSCRP